MQVVPVYSTVIGQSLTVLWPHIFLVYFIFCLLFFAIYVSSSVLMAFDYNEEDIIWDS